MPTPTPTPIQNTIHFERGKHTPLTATRTFSLGKTGLTIHRGSVVYFDGSTVEYGGTVHPAPEVIGAYRAGWLVPEEVYDENAAVLRPSAGVQVRHSTNGGNPMQPNGGASRMTMALTQHDEREVMSSVKDHATAARERNTPPRVARQQMPTVGGADMQDGVPVRQLKTLSGEASKQARTTLTGSSTYDAIRQATTSGVIDPGQGRTEDEFLAGLSPDEREEYLAKKSFVRSQYDATTVSREPVRAHTQVARVQRPTTHTVEGITLHTSTGSGFDAPVDLSPLKDGVGDVDGARIVGTVNREAPRPAVIMKPAGEDIRRKIAKSVCPDFPDLYDFTQPLKKKMARLHADFDDRPDILRAVFAAEGDEVKAALVDEFPEIFG